MRKFGVMSTLRSLFASARTDDSDVARLIFAASDLYVGAHAGIATLRVQGRAEGRREAGAPWDGSSFSGDFFRLKRTVGRLH